MNNSNYKLGLRAFYGSEQMFFKIFSVCEFNNKLFYSRQKPATKSRLQNCINHDYLLVWTAAHLDSVSQCIYIFTFRIVLTLKISMSGCITNQNAREKCITRFVSK